MYLIEPIRNGQYLPDGALTLAMQVYVLNHLDLDETILFPYYCKPKVEIGRFQNAEVEVNHDYLKEHDIQLVRRDTGGGAVYCDQGAVNVCQAIPISMATINVSTHPLSNSCMIWEQVRSNKVAVMT